MGRINEKQNAFQAKKPIVEKIAANQWVRNKVGAHYNEPESPVTPAEVRALAEALDELFGATFSQSCGSTIAKVDDKTWKCDCGGLRYQPESEKPEVVVA